MAENNPHEEKTVLRDYQSGGPKGLGDPDDRRMRIVEGTTIVEKRMREKARIEKCVPEVNEFTECGQKAGLMLVFKCQKEKNKMRECLSRWYHDEDFRQEVTEDYLKERAEYRRTGVGQRYRRYEAQS